MKSPADPYALTLIDRIEESVKREGATPNTLALMNALRATLNPPETVVETVESPKIAVVETTRSTVEAPKKP